jgi:hypothetical protein
LAATKVARRIPARDIDGPVPADVYSAMLDPDVDPETQCKVTRPDEVGVASVEPGLLLMSNGGLACSVGRPGNSIMFDPTGTAEHWKKSIVVYFGGLTGYTTMPKIAPGKLLYIYDAPGVDDASGHDANCLRGIEIAVATNHGLETQKHKEAP